MTTTTPPADAARRDALDALNALGGRRSGRRAVRVVTRVDVGLAERLDTAARAAGRTRTSYVEQLLRANVPQQLPEAEPDTAA